MTSILARLTHPAAPRATQQPSRPGSETRPKYFLYWLGQESFRRMRLLLEGDGFKLSATRLTPCQVLRAQGKTVVFAPPAIWSRACVRQGSWYRASTRDGKYMLMSATRLPVEMDPYLDAVISDSDFKPDRLPSSIELVDLVQSDEYKNNKPDDWEKKTFLDRISFKTFFTIIGFWKKGDSLSKHWIGHRANHANFLAKHFTTRIGDEEVAYSVTANKRICSSCAETFNVVDDSSRKLVRSCPGAIAFGGAERDVYLDVIPVKSRYPK